MKSLSFSFLACAASVLVTGSLCAKADSKPSFDEDAKPILNQQPGLVQYVESNFQVKETGIAKYPGDEDHAPVPPYIFRAREKGSHGPYNLSLLVQPGPPGHILGIVKDATGVAPAAPQSAPTKAPAPAHQPAQIPAEQQPAYTSDTPSGPIGAASSTNTTNPASTSSNAPSLAPPPDPVPQPH